MPGGEVGRREALPVPHGQCRVVVTHSAPNLAGNAERYDDKKSFLVTFVVHGPTMYPCRQHVAVGRPVPP